MSEGVRLKGSASIGQSDLDNGGRFPGKTREELHGWGVVNNSVRVGLWFKNPGDVQVKMGWPECLGTIQHSIRGKGVMGSGTREFCWGLGSPLALEWGGQDD